jgi:hypothetical protein
LRNIVTIGENCIEVQGDAWIGAQARRLVILGWAVARTHPHAHNRGSPDPKRIGWTGLAQWSSTGEADMKAQLRRRNPVVAPSMEHERGDVHSGGGWLGAVKQQPHLSAPLF